MGEGTIVPHSLKNKGNKKLLKLGQKFFFQIIYDTFVLAKNSFFQHLIH